MIDDDLRTDLVRLAGRAPLRDDGWDRVVAGRRRARRRRLGVLVALVVLLLFGGSTLVLANRAPRATVAVTSQSLGLASEAPSPSTTVATTPAAPETPEEVIARTVTGADPLLLPDAIPSDWRAETTARWDGFAVRYTSPDGGRWISVQISVPNPNPDPTRGTQRLQSFRGDPNADYGIYDATDARSRRWVLWVEPGRWDLGNATTGAGVPGVPYFVISEGIPDDEFWQYAASLKEIALPRSEHPTISVAPSSGLRDGQTVQVTVRGFPGGSKVFLSECPSVGSANPLGCGVQLAQQPFLLADDGGSGSGAFTVADAASPKPFEGTPVEPCTDQCVLVATWGAQNSDTGTDTAYVSAPLAFSSG